MQLNHLNLPVEDVAASRRFFEQYFGFETIDTKGDDMLAVLSGSDGFSLVLMANSFNRKGNAAYPDAFHIGFLLGTKEEVTALYNRLLSGGVPVQEPGSRRGVFGFYFHAPGPILTEVSCILG